MKNFYQKLKSFEEFSEVTTDRHYAVVPGDWWVVVADIKGSTQAVEEGRYKDVNTLGAAVIVAVQNQLGDGIFPFVFGGDGATLVIPPGKLDAAKQQLSALRSLARSNFNLSLQIGAIQVSELVGVSVEVAKLKIAGRRSLAVFRGGGLTKAEELVKQGSGHHHFPKNPESSANLSGLSCRWQPIKPQRDYAVSLLIKSRVGNDIYQQVLSDISQLYDGQLDRANPINLNGTSYRSIRQCYHDERRYHKSPWSLKFAWRMFEITVAVLIFKYGMPGPINAGKYAHSISRHSDYRKFDDMLRMVIDCSETQIEHIRSMLQTLHKEGKIYYGMHLAKESLMTCFFNGAGDGKHLHFIDGGDGGYTMAAKQLKDQILER